MMYKSTEKVAGRLRALAMVPALLAAAAAVNSSPVAMAVTSAGSATLTAPAAAVAVATGASEAVAATQATTRENSEKKDEPQAAVAVMPEYPGGMPALIQFLASNIHYPKEAENAGTQGRVVVKFVVGKDGSVGDAEVIRSLSPETDAEALRVVSSMPLWTPGKNEQGQAVSCYFTVPVQFSLTKDDDSARSTKKAIRISGPSSTTTATTTTTTTDADGKTETTILMSINGKDVTDHSMSPGKPGAPAYFVDGKPFDGNLADIPAADIKAMTVRNNDPAYPHGAVYIELNK